MSLLMLRILENRLKEYHFKNVKKDINYVMIISSSAGLWGYNTGDTVKFTSINPYRIIVTEDLNKACLLLENM